MVFLYRIKYLLIMVLSATLHITGHKNEDKGIRLLTCDYQFTQDYDQNGLPRGKVLGGIVNISFESIEDNEIIQWMMSVDADKDGKISFWGDNNTKTFKTLEFHDARLVSYAETFSDQMQMVTALSFSAREIIISGVKHTNAWQGY
jgi:hypothetical protein